MKKKLVLLFCIVSCVLMMAGCSLSLTKTNENFDKETLETNTDAFIASWFEFDFAASVEEYADQLDDETMAQYKESAEYQEKYGEAGEKVKTEFTINTDSAAVTETWTTSSGKKIIFTVSFDEEGNTTSWKVEEYVTLKDKMAKAGLNTVLSMGIVFIVLIFIALLIYAFKFLTVFEKKEETPVAEANVVEESGIEENLVDDLELVAVITAAIAAANETESADGLVIRSIIRR